MIDIIKIDVPDGKSGNWEVKTFKVSDEDSKMMRIRSVFNKGRGRLPAGTYKKLNRGSVLVMSNTPDEIRDCLPFVHRARGSVLVNGLGLGVLLKLLLEKEEITDITVIEKSKDVIALVAPTYAHEKRLTIINEDAFAYKPPKGKRYDCVWHDIWDYICGDNLPEMKSLHRKYGKRADLQLSWCRAECERQAC